MTKEYRQALEALRLLTPEQRDMLFDEYDNSTYGKDADPAESAIEWNSALEKFVTERRFSKGRICAHCGEKNNIVMCGHTDAGNQRYRCNSCRRTFTATSNTPLHGVKKDYRTIKRFIFSMVNGWSLDRTAAYCKIHRNTAHRWRHKILDAVSKKVNTVVLDGIVEADGTYFEESFKGNHQNDGFVMPRKRHSRGAQLSFKQQKDKNGNIIEPEDPWHPKKKRGISSDKICVACAVSRDGVAISRTVSKGRPTGKSVESVLSGAIAPGTHFCTDRHTSYLKFAKSANLDHIRVSGTRGSLHGIYHIQHVNEYHNQLRKFVNIDLHGVSTKHLHKYLAWNVFLKSNKTSYEEKERQLGKIIATSTGTIRCTDIAKLPPTLQKVI